MRDETGCGRQCWPVTDWGWANEGRLAVRNGCKEQGSRASGSSRAAERLVAALVENVASI